MKNSMWNSIIKEFFKEFLSYILNSLSILGLFILLGMVLWKVILKIEV